VELYLKQLPHPRACEFLHGFVRWEYSQFNTHKKGKRICVRSSAFVPKAVARSRSGRLILFVHVVARYCKMKISFVGSLLCSISPEQREEDIGRQSEAILRSAKRPFNYLSFEKV